jgi:hypothetical protein
MVFGVFTIISTRFETVKQQETRRIGTRGVGSWPGWLVMARLQAGVSWTANICAWTMVRWLGFLCYKLLDIRCHGIRYSKPTSIECINGKEAAVAMYEIFALSIIS